jgi:proteic killer suppression protein
MPFRWPSSTEFARPSGTGLSDAAPGLLPSPGQKIPQRFSLAPRIVYRYTIRVILSYRHKGLKLFAETGSKAGILPMQAARLLRLLTALNVASRPGDMDAPGNNLHPLKGELAGHWSVKVNGNWRLTFSFEGEDAILVDYQDYH